MFIKTVLQKLVGWFGDFGTKLPHKIERETKIAR